MNVYPYIAGSDSVFWFVQDNESQEQDVSVTVKGLLELLLSERKKSEQYKVEFVLCVNLTPWSFVADNYFVLNNLFTESFLKEEEILYFNNRLRLHTQEMRGIRKRRPQADEQNHD